MRKILSNVLVSSEMDLNAKSHINAILLPSGWFTFFYHLVIMWLVTSKTSSWREIELSLPPQSSMYLCSKHGPCMLEICHNWVLGGSNLILFCLWVQILWVLLVTILINCKCWSISLFCHGFRVNSRVWVFNSLIYICIVCLKVPTLTMFLYFSRACHSLWIYWTIAIMRTWRTQQRTTSLTSGGGIQTLLNSFLCQTAVR